MSPDASLLSVSDLRVVFDTPRGPARAVDGVDLAVRKGEVLALVGESGCGKSLTSLAVLGLLPPAARVATGRVAWKGRDLLGVPERELRKVRGREIALVLQDPMTALNPCMRAGEHVAEVLRVHLGMSRAEARARAIELFGEVGIPDPAARVRSYPHELSGGMRQRVLIACAIACGPDLLIADEPTTALDVTIQAQVLRLLMEERARRGLAVLFITHDLGVVAEVADRVAVMYAGRIVEEGPASALFDRPLHPYTRGLFGALPSAAGGATRLAAIPGTVPDPAAVPAGCRFHPRCPVAEARCREADQSLLDVAEGRRAACWKAVKDVA